MRKRFKISEKLTLELTKKGFVLWDTEKHEWLIDASALLDDGLIEVSKKLKEVKRPSWYPYHLPWREFRLKSDEVER